MTGKRRYFGQSPSRMLLFLIPFSLLGLALSALALKYTGYNSWGARRPIFTNGAGSQSLSAQWVGRPDAKSVIARSQKDFPGASARDGWRAVVVGEGQAPRHCQKPDCHFLGPEQQAALRLRIARLLPSGGVARRSLGVLWAMQQGAQLLQEVEEGMLLYHQGEPKLPQTAWLPLGGSVPALAYVGAEVFNPFWHFGQPTLWPRGLPLSCLGQRQPSKYILFSWPAPLIQHKLVDGSPDVDAVFRLTRTLASQPLNVTFDRTAPNVLLPRGVLAPFGGRGNLFRPQAFWAMLLPPSLSPSEGDIWRSYWAQRLLWEVGGTVAFVRPDAFQEDRTGRTGTEELNDVGALNQQASQLIAFLHAWQCPPAFAFSACMLQLSRDMAEAGFWQQSDADLVSAWLQDLDTLGYALPTRIRSNVTRAQLLEHFHGQPLGAEDAYDPATRKTRVIFHPVQQAPPLLTLDLARHLQEAQQLQMAKRLQSLCPQARFQLSGLRQRKGVLRPRTLLVTEFNHPYYDNIPHLERNNRHRYPTLLYCGNNITKFLNSDIGADTEVTFVEASVGNRGFTGYECMIHAADMGYSVDALFFLSEDVLVNFWNMGPSLAASTWTVEYNWNPDPWWVPWKGPMGISAISQALTELNMLAARDPRLKQVLEHVFVNLYGQRNMSVPAVLPNSTSVVPGGLSDVYQVSAQDAPAYVAMARVFRKHNAYMEAAVPFMLSGLHGQEVVKFTPGVAGYPPDAFLTMYKPNLKYIHPVKWRLVFQEEHKKTFLCEYYYVNMFTEV